MKLKCLSIALSMTFASLVHARPVAGNKAVLLRRSDDVLTERTPGGWKSLKSLFSSNKFGEFSTDTSSADLGRSSSLSWYRGGSSRSSSTRDSTPRTISGLESPGPRFVRVNSVSHDQRSKYPITSHTWRGRTADPEESALRVQTSGHIGGIDAFDLKDWMIRRWNKAMDDDDDAEKRAVEREYAAYSGGRDFHQDTTNKD